MSILSYLIVAINFPPRRAPVLMILWLKQCHKYYGVTYGTVSIPCGSAALFPVPCS